MIRKLILLTLVTTTIFAACKKDGVTEEGEKNNTTFSAYENNFLEALWKLDPNWATQEGFHKYDSLLVMPDAKSRGDLLHFVSLQMDSMARYDAGRLSASNQMDFKLMQNLLDKMQWQLQQERAYEWNPATYNIINTFAFILTERYAPLEKRLRNFHQKMANVPAYYKEAQKQIKNPAPELLSLAADQLTGGLPVFEDDFIDSLKKTNIPKDEQKLMAERAKASASAIKGFVAWLKSAKADKPRSFRLGKELYEAKFKYNIQSAGSAQQLFNAAQDKKKQLHIQMAKLSNQLWPKYFGTKPKPADSLLMIRQVIDTLSAKHVQADGFQAAIEKQLPQLVAFVKAKRLLTLDDSKPLIVRRQPAYMSGVAGASVSAPGPYDKGGNTYYNVGSLAGWPAAKAESYLREYNNYTLQILNIHEAIPGHYTQLVYANKSPSIIKSVLGNGAMIEGWAVYSEQMMLEAGYGNNEPEFWLMWYKWLLRSVCNTIIDYNVHTGSLDKEGVVKFLTHDAFQQQTEAENKWKRVSVTSVQLTSYYAGYKEIIDLREAWKKQAGDKYVVKDFNEKFLGYGNAPVKFIREAMLAKVPANSTPVK